MGSKSKTLIVVAAVDDSFVNNLLTLQGGPVKRMDTSGGGHPSAAFIRAFKEYPQFESYLFLQDSLKGIEPDVVAPFRENGAEVVAWGLFGMAFDNQEQANWVESQYEPHIRPQQGIFGPIFYATNAAMKKAEPFFPKTPSNRNEAQGSERAWAYTFAAADIRVGTLGAWDNHAMSVGPYPVFRKTFAARP